MLPRLRIAEVKVAVAREFEITIALMESAQRYQDVVVPRQIAFLILREHQDPPHSLPKIGREFGKRDHTTVISGLVNVKRKLAKSLELRDKFNAVVAQLAAPNEEEENGRAEVQGHGPAAEEEGPPDRRADDARQS